MVARPRLLGGAGGLGVTSQEAAGVAPAGEVALLAHQRAAQAAVHLAQRERALREVEASASVGVARS